MTVGYVLRYWPTLSETFVAREIEALTRRGITVEVVAIGRRRDPGRGHPVEEVRVWRPPRGRSWVRATPSVLAVWRTGVGRRVLREMGQRLRRKDALRVAWVAQLARQRGWDRLHAHFAGEAAVWAEGAAALAELPYTVTVHATDLFVPRDDLSQILQGAERVVTICAHHRRWLAERHRVDSAVVRCGVDPDRYTAPRPQEPRWAWVCVARDVPKKGLDDLVEATRAVGGVLRLVSDGVRLGGPGVLVGPADADAVPRILARSSVFVLPARPAASGDRDGIPVALMEAMASGLPVVATDVSGISELVDDQVGWIAPAADPQGLADVLREARADPEEARRRGAAGRRRIREQQWTVARQAAELAALWHGG